MAGAADAPESSGARKFSFRPLRLRNNSQSTMNAILPLFVRWDVNPTMISIGSFEIRYYGLMWALALGISAYIFSRIIKREGYPDKLFDSIFWYGVLSTIIGARLGHCLFYDPGYYLTHPVEILYIHQGGLASHGAAVGLLVGLWLFSRKNKMPYIWSLDRIAIAVGIAGALHVVTSVARTEERNTLVPPVNRVELLPDAQPGFLDVIDLLARYGETDRDDAQQTYNSWLAQVSSEEGVTIDSVGLVSEGTFRPAPQMAVVLNPAGTAPMRLPRKGSGNGLLWWVVLAVVVGAGISVGAIAWLESRDAPYPPRTPRTATAPSEAGDAAEDNLPSSPASLSGAEADTAAGNVVPAKELTPSVPSVPAAGQKRYYVIVGAYSTEQNADRFIAEARKKDDSLPYEKLPQPNGRILISIFGSDSERQAVQKKREYEVMFEGSWVYEASVRK